MKKLDIFLVAIVFAIGGAIVGWCEKEPQVITVEKRVEYWDLSSITLDKIETAANIFNRTLYNKEKVEKRIDDELGELRRQQELDRARRDGVEQGKAMANRLYLIK